MADVLTESDFREELKHLSGGYLFFGNEDYLKFTYSKEVRKAVLDGNFDEFNHIVIYSDEYSATALVSAVESLPMMSEKKLVEVRGVDFTSLKKSEIEELEGALASIKECDHTVLIIRADEKYFNPGRLPKNPSELYKVFSKYLKPVQFDFPQPARLKNWIIKHFQGGNIQFDPTLCEYLVQVCGHSMWALANEIDKLCAYLASNGIKVLTKEHIDLVCTKTVEYGEFQFSNAVLNGDKNDIFETLKRQKANKEPPNIILNTVIKTYLDLNLVKNLMLRGMNKQQIAKATKMHEYKVGLYMARCEKISPAKLNRALEVCKDADISMKSKSNVTGYLAVERLLSLLCVLVGK